MTEDGPFSELSQDTEVTIQTGSHTPPDESQIRREQFLKGDLNMSLWSSDALKARLTQIQPDALCIDGIMPNSASLRGKTYHNWPLLPLRPRDLNPNQQIKLIAGDFFSLEFAVDTLLSNSDAAHYKLIADTRINTVKLSDAADLGAFGLGTLLLGVLSDKRNDRRAFLRNVGKISGYLALGSLGTTLGLAAGRLSGHRLGDLIGNPELYQVFVEVTQLAEAKLFKDDTWYRDGRTALLISKSLEAKQGKTAVVMGPGHIFGSTDMLHNKDRRTSQIKTFFDKMSSFLESIKAENPELQHVDITSRFRDYLPRYDILEVTDPGDTPIHPTDLETLGYIKQTGSFISEEIKEAIS